MIEQIFTASVFAAMIRLATPYLYASIGETFSQRSGVLNLGLEGMMLVGAFMAFYTVYETDSLLLGVLVAMAVGGLMGLAMAFVSVTMRAEQGISGIGFYLLGLGLSTLLFEELLGVAKPNRGFQPLDIPLLSDIKFLGIGEIIFSQSLLVYTAFALVPLAAYILNRTSFGLQIRAVGQNPEAADAMGVSVARVRYMAVTLGGTLAGLAGASLSIGSPPAFQQNLTAGIGFIAVALVYFGSWRPYGVLAGALLFSFINALKHHIEVVNIPIEIQLPFWEFSGNTEDIPSEFLIMAPYVITIIALIFASKRVEKPTALTKPFARGK